MFTYTLLIMSKIGKLYNVSLETHYMAVTWILISLILLIFYLQIWLENSAQRPKYHNASKSENSYFFLQEKNAELRSTYRILSIWNFQNRKTCEDRNWCLAECRGGKTAEQYKWWRNGIILSRIEEWKEWDVITSEDRIYSELGGCIISWLHQKVSCTF